MSVLAINKKVFEQVLNRMLYYGQQSEIDINFCEYLKKLASKRTIEQYEEECKIIMQNLSNLVIKSHHYKYTPNEPLLEIYFETINIDRKTAPINTYQFLKFLVCIKYNIEVKTIGVDRMTIYESGAYAMLLDIITSIQYTVIDNLPEYKKANWSEPVN